ncbi:MAG: hypothetical protein NZ585_12505 [Chloracidobacterium sp.]|nr:hypothetical protein [Chloracidobacterium sp.]MDW8216247.1 V4R domain-containing protein [Acidobacteriota bacterium]
MTAPVVFPLPETNQRRLWWPSDLIVAIHTELARRLPDEAAGALYRLGRLTGVRWLRERAADAEVQPEQAPLSARLRRCDEWFADAGWGRVDATPLGAVLIVNHYNSPIAAALRAAGSASTPVDDFFAGFFAEAATQYAGRPQESVEISCLAVNAHYCRFVVGEASIIRKVYAWLTYQHDPRDILRRLADETTL